MNEERAFIATFGNGEIRLVIERADGRQEWCNPNHEMRDFDFKKEWAALWSKASRTQEAIDGEKKFQTYKTQPWLATVGDKWK